MKKILFLSLIISSSVFCNTPSRLAHAQHTASLPSCNKKLQRACSIVSETTYRFCKKQSEHTRLKSRGFIDVNLRSY